MDAVTLQNNINVFENYTKMIKNSPDVQEKVKAGKITLGVKGDTLVVVNYGDSFISSLIESIKHIFNGVRVGAKAENCVREMDAVRGQAHLEKQKAFEASRLGQAYNAGKFIGESVLDFMKRYENACGG